jgi:hypothetical protein
MIDRERGCARLVVGAPPVYPSSAMVPVRVRLPQTHLRALMSLTHQRVHSLSVVYSCSGVVRIESARGGGRGDRALWSRSRAQGAGRTHADDRAETNERARTTEHAHTHNTIPPYTNHTNGMHDHHT